MDHNKPSRFAQAGGHAAQCADHPRLVVRHLPVRKSQCLHARRPVGLLADQVPGLLRRRAVVAKAVGLDHQTELRPEEVNPEPVHLPAGSRHSQPGSRGQRLYVIPSLKLVVVRQGDGDLFSDARFLRLLLGQDR